MTKLSQEPKKILLTPAQLDKDFKFIFKKLYNNEENNRLIENQLSRLNEELRQLDNASFDFETITRLLIFIERLDINNQKPAKELLNFILVTAVRLLRKDELSNRDNYELTPLGKLSCLINMVRTLPGLPIDWRKHIKLLEILLTKIQSIFPKIHVDDNISLPMPYYQLIAQLLSAVIKLPIAIKCYKDFFDFLLEAFNPEFFIGDKFEVHVLGPLWQYLIFSEKHLSQNKHWKKMLTTIESIIEKENKSSNEDSNFQQRITDEIEYLLNPTASAAMRCEYPIGPYKADIAFIKEKLIIEINGPHHYRDKTLRRTDQFRAFILKKYQGWNTINLAYFEIGEIKNKPRELAVLLTAKLEKYKHLLKTNVLAPQRNYFGKASFNTGNSNYSPAKYIPPYRREASANNKQNAATQSVIIPPQKNDKYIPPHKRHQLAK